MLVVTRGREMTRPLLIKPANFAQRRAIDDKLMVLVPVGDIH